MLKYLFKRGRFLMIFPLLYSCKLYQSELKEAQREEQTQSNYKQQLDIWYRGLSDSQSRYWLFWTDSSFRFHPDSGLIGQKGQLAMLESQVRISAKQEASTKSSASRIQMLKQQSTEKWSAWAALNLRIIGLLLVAFALAWKFRNFFKTFLR
ncbi:hypothetical protein [Sphingobacterium sp. 2149]|uniref:hypothetical protein n=1 Tax=Sphingobacterium sp. 2149 TaxID=2817763 RepID=UPI00285A8A0B|nr:hypothetical protein [Sphingobacterium sp. 2149]MDR6734491.1 hypothetical protein [Sphingobacterium sp. 2149]